MMRALLVPVIIVSFSGCAFQPTRPAKVPGGPVVNTVDTTKARIALENHKPATACPPGDAAYRVRDLTRPWRDRVYLLGDGTTCRPPRRVS